MAWTAKKNQAKHRIQLVIFSGDSAITKRHFIPFWLDRNWVTWCLRQDLWVTAWISLTRCLKTLIGFCLLLQSHLPRQELAAWEDFGGWNKKDRRYLFFCDALLRIYRWWYLVAIIRFQGPSEPICNELLCFVWRRRVCLLFSGGWRRADRYTLRSSRTNSSCRGICITTQWRACCQHWPSFSEAASLIQVRLVLSSLRCLCWVAGSTGIDKACSN